MKGKNGGSGKLGEGVVNVVQETTAKQLNECTSVEKI